MSATVRGVPSPPRRPLPLQRCVGPVGEAAGTPEECPAAPPVHCRVPPPARWDVLLVHRDRLLTLARRRGCTDDDAQDVVQEALLRTASHPDLDHERAGAFLTATVRRLVIDGHRHRHRQQRLADHAALRPQPEPSHEDAVCDHAEGAWLRQQTTELRPRERAALLARADGHTGVRIAADLGVTVKAVEMITRRGRVALQALLVTACVLTSVNLGVPGVPDTSTSALGTTTDDSLDDDAATVLSDFYNGSTPPLPTSRRRGTSREAAAFSLSRSAMHRGRRSEGA